MFTQRNRIHRRMLLTVTALAAASTVPALGQSFTGLGDLDGGMIYSEAWGVSADGSTVVGASITNGHILFGATYGAFRWTAGGGLEDIYNLGGIGTTCRAYAVNRDGSVIVGMADYGVLTPTQIVAFVWTPGDGALEIGDLPGGPSGSSRSAARGVSADGSVIAGQGESDSGAEPFRYTVANSTFQGLGDLPGGAFGGSAYGISGDGATVVGSSITTDESTQAFLWSEEDGMIGIGHLGVPEGITPFSEAYAANADGSVVIGLSRSPESGNNGWEAFRWTESGGMVGLGDLPTGVVLSAAYAMTPDGSIIVGSGGIQGNCNPFGCPTIPRAMIWDEQNGMRDLKTVLTAAGLDVTGWTLTDARGISADGRVIVGNGTNPAGDNEAWRAEVSAPPCPGDVDGNGTVDLTDLAILLSNFGTLSGATLEDGDLNGDGAVDLTDLAAMLSSFGTTC
jgi:probable HAF family extracellular repeat protein